MINDGQLVLKIIENAKNCALSMNVDHETYNKLPNYNLDRVSKIWVMKFKFLASHSE